MSFYKNYKPSNYFKKLRSEKSVFLTIIFTILLFLIEEITFDGPHTFAFLRTFFISTIPDGGIFKYNTPLSFLFTSISFFTAIIIFWLSFVSSKPYKILYLLLFCLASFVQFSYWDAINRHFNVFDFYVGITTSPDVWFFSIREFFSFLVFIPIGLYAGFLFFIKPQNPYQFKSLILISGLVALIGLTSYAYDEPDFTTFSSLRFYKSFVQIVMVEADQQTNQRVQLPSTDIDIVKPNQNIIYIIDESIRPDHLSLYGYERETTPILEKLNREGSLIHWADAISSASCSIASNAILISGIKDMPDTNRLIYKNPTIFQYANAMGYQTHYYNIAYRQLWNGLQSGDHAYIDFYVNNKDLSHVSQQTADMFVAKQLADIIKSETGHFFVINKVGVHFPYEDNFPEDATLWTNSPPNLPNDSAFDLINSYDNGVRYNVESFFQILLKDQSLLENTTIVYTSDHGQNLGEVQGQASHCGRSKYEVQVPILLIGNNLPDKIDTNFKAHHMNIFSTVLDLMSVPSEMRVVNYPLSLLQATEKDSTKRYYMAGDENIFTGNVTPYDD